MADLCIVHKGCSDGLTAAWILKHAYPDIQVHQAAYHEPPPINEVRDQTVIMADVTWDPTGMLAMLDACQSMEVYDHHQTATRLLEDPRVTEHESLDTLMVDQDRSAARIIWDEFGGLTSIPYQQSDGLPRLVRFVEDRDLWRNRYSHTAPVTEWVYTLPRTVDAFEKAACMIHEDFNHVLSVGQGIVSLKENTSLALLERAWPATINGHSALVVNGTQRISSILGNHLAEHSPDGIGVTYWPQEGGYALSLRSTQDGPDVATIAEEQWGGGGHPNAAGAYQDTLPSVLAQGRDGE